MKLWENRFRDTRAKNNPRGGGGGGCLIKSVIQAAAEADVRAHVRQTPSYSNVPEQNGKEGCRAWEGQTPRRRSDVD